MTFLDRYGRWAVIEGRCEDVLATLPAEAFDLCLSDVPYGLGTREPSVEEIIAYLQGAPLDTRGDFMGRKWAIPPLAVWRAVHAALRPGAHAFVFGGTRTWDLISMGLRAAGFENRDTIAADHPALRWDHGQGFPKSLDVSKAIDASLGAEPIVIGPHPTNQCPGGEWCHCDEGTERAQNGATKHPPATAWDGWGSALKPSWEPVLVFRKALDGTLAGNTLKHGCGGLNIDACRIRYGNEADQAAAAAAAAAAVQRACQDQNAGRTAYGEYTNGPASLQPYLDKQSLGRFPPNRVLVHAPECARVGEHSELVPLFDATSKDRFLDRGEVTCRRTGELRTETVADWRCVEGCPVRELDLQSGIRPGMFGGIDCSHNARGDTGTASRFFPQFQADAPSFYASKASRGEREFGCEGLPAKSRGDVTGREDDAPGCDNPRSGNRRRGEIHNTGPCVKPQAMLRWLARLGCRPGGLVLVPYCGTGSEIIACVASGMRAIGIEFDPEMVAIARTRCAAWERFPGGLTEEAKAETKLEAAGQRSLF